MTLSKFFILIPILIASSACQSPPEAAPSESFTISYDDACMASDTLLYAQPTIVASPKSVRLPSKGSPDIVLDNAAARELYLSHHRLGWIAALLSLRDVWVFQAKPIYMIQSGGLEIVAFERGFRDCMKKAQYIQQHHGRPAAEEIVRSSIQAVAPNDVEFLRDLFTVSRAGGME